MVENGFVPADRAAQVDFASVPIQQQTQQSAVRYFTDWARPQLDTLIDDSTDPIDVWTTLDPNMQNAATKAINADAPDSAQGALVSIDQDGAVRAMVGGRNFVTSNYNRATEAVRQPGSSFKLFV
jgi:penicillin-binding protein 1A